jgi:hypothetical protein
MPMAVATTGAKQMMAMTISKGIKVDRYLLIDLL